MVVSMALIGLIRDRRLRFKLYERAAKIAHIIILGSVTAHITYHNTRYRPRGSGFCVSNHTSPMDMSVLSADCILTLVRREAVDLRVIPRQNKDKLGQFSGKTPNF
jgi:glycerol-3-phosphate O-acyltransferase 3/4